MAKESGLADSILTVSLGQAHETRATTPWKVSFVGMMRHSGEFKAVLYRAGEHVDKLITIPTKYAPLPIIEDLTMSRTATTQRTTVFVFSDVVSRRMSGTLPSSSRRTTLTTLHQKTMPGSGSMGNEEYRFHEA